MLRTQIQLTEAQHHQLRAAAQEAGISMAEMIRRCVGQYFEERAPDRAELYNRAAKLVGRFEDSEGATDVSGRHDEYLNEGYR